MVLVFLGATRWNRAAAQVKMNQSYHWYRPQTFDFMPVMSVVDSALATRVYVLEHVAAAGDSLRYYKYEIASDAENNLAIPFTLKTNATIVYNAMPLRPGQWSGAGTTTLVLILGTKQYDYIQITN